MDAMTIADQAIFTATATASKPSKSYLEERICSEPECETVLSRYNSQTECSLHVHGYQKLPMRGVRIP